MKSKDIDHISQVNKSLHVLIIAYACEPDRGSEPGTGWNVALGLSAFHRVTVATRANNRASIEKFINNYSGSKPEFIYIDPPNWALCLKRYNVMPVQFFYLLWHLYLKKELSCKNISFDIIHQLTFNSFEIPPLVFNSLRGIKIWGPIGGGQTVVLGALRAFGLSGFFKEALRNLRVKLSRYAPWTRSTLCSSDLVLFANPETKNLLSAAFSSNTGMMIDVGVNCDAFHPPIRRADSSKIILLTAGRLESRKGTILLIKAFHKLRDQYPNMELRIVGDGPLRQSLQNEVRKLRLDSRVVFTGAIDHIKMRNEYSNADVFVFPSLRDTSGAVVLEAMSMELPVICFDHQGASLMVTEESGIRVSISTYRKAIFNLALAIDQLSCDPSQRIKLGRNARVEVINHYDWKTKVARLNDYYQSFVS